MNVKDPEIRHELKKLDKDITRLDHRVDGLEELVADIIKKKLSKTEHSNPEKSKPRGNP